MEAPEPQQRNLTCLHAASEENKASVREPAAGFGAAPYPKQPLYLLQRDPRSRAGTSTTGRDRSKVTYEVLRQKRLFARGKGRERREETARGVCVSRRELCTSRARRRARNRQMVQQMLWDRRGLVGEP